jgi:hypothetical protein
MKTLRCLFQALPLLIILNACSNSESAVEVQMQKYFEAAKAGDQEMFMNLVDSASVLYLNDLWLIYQKRDTSLLLNHLDNSKFPFLETVWLSTIYQSSKASLTKEAFFQSILQPFMTIEKGISKEYQLGKIELAGDGLANAYYEIQLYKNLYTQSIYKLSKEYDYTWKINMLYKWKKLEELSQKTFQQFNGSFKNYVRTKFDQKLLEQIHASE